MRRLIGITLLAAFLNAQSKPAAYATPVKSAAESIEEWQKDTQVTLDDDARTQLLNDVGQADWSKIFVPAQQHEQALAWTKDIAVRAYLYSLLDPARAQDSLKLAQIADHPFAKFIGTLKNEPFGFIEFLSAPVGAAILRDHEAIGRTPMGFIASGDTHTYDIVLSKEITCESTIRPRPGTTDRMTCPE